MLRQKQDEAAELIKEGREIPWELRPSVLDRLGLVPAIRSFLSRFSDYYKIDGEHPCSNKRQNGGPPIFPLADIFLSKNTRLWIIETALKFTEGVPI